MLIRWSTNVDSRNRLMAATRMEVGDILRADIMRTYDYLQGSGLRRAVNCLRSPGVQAVIVFRFGQWLDLQASLLKLPLQPVYFVLNGLVKIMWGIELPRSATIGPGFYIGHFGGITIAPGATIGSNCNISQHITIGLSGQGEKAGVPTIGDNVYLAPGARVFGKISIGNNVKIGANAVVYKDIPDNAVVVLEPGFKIVSYKGNRGLAENEI
jgi:serine O-acetyltransferase